MNYVAWHILQSTVFAVAIGLLVLAFRRDRARTRHWLWLAASVKFLIPFSLLMTLSARLPWREAPAVPPPQMTFVMADFTLPAVAPTAAPAAPPVHTERLPDALWAIWICGSAAFFLRWRLRWSKVAAAVRRAARAGRPKATVLDSPSIHEPCVFGIFRPVLLLPTGIEQRLTRQQLEAVVAHELCHLRRGDNLAGAVHMVVECLFWFHPLVWWIGARLVEERELACDEEVLSLGADPAVYAEGILKICEFCCESALPCVSGITGADLIRRIESIVNPRVAGPLRRGKKILLAAFSLAVIAAPLAVGIARLEAQPPPRTAAPLRFEVASVKPVEQSWLQIFPQRSGGRITWTTDLRYLVEYAYHLSEWRVSGTLPGSEHIYAVDVRTSPSATDEQVRLMFQTLLAERFQMATHRVTKEVEGFALTVAKNGPKFQEVQAEDKAPPMPEWFRQVPAGDANMENKVVATLPMKGVVAITGRRATMLQLSESLQKVLRVAVLDQTGLAGYYYFAFEFAQEDHPDDTPVPTLSTAIQRELGLRLEKHKGPVEILVIDRISTTPTEN